MNPYLLIANDVEALRHRRENARSVVIEVVDQNTRLYLCLFSVNIWHTYILVTYITYVTFETNIINSTSQKIENITPIGGGLLFFVSLSAYRQIRFLLCAQRRCLGRRVFWGVLRPWMNLLTTTPSRRRKKGASYRKQGRPQTCRLTSLKVSAAFRYMNRKGTVEIARYDIRTNNVNKTQHLRCPTPIAKIAIDATTTWDCCQKSPETNEKSEIVTGRVPV